MCAARTTAGQSFTRVHVLQMLGHGINAPSACVLPPAKRNRGRRRQPDSPRGLTNNVFMEYAVSLWLWPSAFGLWLRWALHSAPAMKTRRCTVRIIFSSPLLLIMLLLLPLFLLSLLSLLGPCFIGACCWLQVADTHKRQCRRRQQQHDSLN